MKIARKVNECSMILGHHCAGFTVEAPASGRIFRVMEILGSHS
jgi:hypothetical protein